MGRENEIVRGRNLPRPAAQFLVRTGVAWCDIGVGMNAPEQCQLLSQVLSQVLKPPIGLTATSEYQVNSVMLW
jgi:hypothetical protein